MTVELYGNMTRATVWGGIVSLAESGSYPIAIVVFIASILVPIVKLAILFFLTFSAGTPYHRRFKMSLYSFVESIGRWSMLDIFLLAVLVAVMKLGHFADVRPEPGAVMFLLVVIFTMLSSAYFDPRLIWEDPKHDAA